MWQFLAGPRSANYAAALTAVTAYLDGRRCSHCQDAGDRASSGVDWKDGKERMAAWRQCIMTNGLTSLQVQISVWCRTSVRSEGLMVVGRVVGEALGRIGSVLVEVVYPARCAGCGRRGCWVCRDCDAALPRFVPPWCQRCGVPITLNDCVCSELPLEIGGLRSVGRYDGWLRRAIVRFKYEEEWARADHLSAALAEPLATWQDLEALVPVPLHPERLRFRTQSGGCRCPAWEPS